MLLIAAGLQDPGNLGTIARAGEALSDRLILWETYGKPLELEVRSRVGGIVLSSADSQTRNSPVSWPRLRRAARVVLATSSHKGTTIPDVDLRVSMALLIGNEGAGDPKHVLAQADEIVDHPAFRATWNR